MGESKITQVAQNSCVQTCAEVGPVLIVAYCVQTQRDGLPAAFVAHDSTGALILAVAPQRRRTAVGLLLFVAMGPSVIGV
jgi:hypothetical protein